MGSRSACLGLVLTVAAPACVHPPATTDAGPSGELGLDVTCGEHLKRSGPACVPTLDDCQGDRVPTPGGGCQRVGVQECDGGLAGPPRWACKPMGPPRSCKPGWTTVKQGWCEPVLPKTACPEGMMERIGAVTCQPVGDCGSGSYGKIAVTATTIFVDATTSAAPPDGSEARPYQTIAAALAAAPSKAQIAVAAGTYVEDLTIDKPVTLRGRCPQLVTIEGSGSAAVTVKARGVTLDGLTLTGGGDGLRLVGGQTTAQGLVVTDCMEIGIRVTGGGKLELADALVAANKAGGVNVVDSTAALKRTVVRGNLIDLTKKQPVPSGGIVAHRVTAPTSLTLQECVVASNQAVGVVLGGASATIGRSAVHWTAPLVARAGASPTAGEGVLAFHTGGHRASVTLRDCLLASNSTSGVFLLSSTGVLERTVVRGTKKGALNTGIGVGAYQLTKGVLSSLTIRESAVVDCAADGVGIGASSGKLDRVVISGNGGGLTVVRRHYMGRQDIFVDRASLEASDCVISDNAYFGVYAQGAACTLTRTVVRDTRATALNPRTGWGIALQPEASVPAKLILRDSLVAGSHTAGVYLVDSSATIETSVLRDTRAAADFGFGIDSHYYGSWQPTLVLRQSLVSNSTAIGINLNGTKATVERSVVRDTRSRSGTHKDWGEGIYATPANGRRTSLSLSDTLVAGNRTSGLLLLSSSAKVRRSLIRGTRGEQATGRYGDGIEVTRYLPQLPKATLEIQESHCAGNARAGLLFVGSSGSVRRSAFSGGVFGIALESGADPVIEASNHIHGNEENRITFGQQLRSAATGQIPPPP